MLNKKQRLSQLLGVYIDEEADLTNLLNSKISSEGLWFKLSLTSIPLFSKPLSGFLDNNFLIIDNKKKIRNNLIKPFLSTDDIYTINFCINKQKKLSQTLTFELDLSNSYNAGVTINQDNFSFWKEALKQKFILIQILKIKKGIFIEKNIQEEFLNNSTDEYSVYLKNKILRSLNYLKNQKLILHRLELWGFSNLKTNEIPETILKLHPSDFGIKDVVKLRKVWQDFSLNISNQDLLNNQDPELNIYLNKIQKMIFNLEKNIPLEIKINKPI